MSEDCRERSRLESEWNQAVNDASNLEKEQHEATLAGHVVPGLAAKIEAWERAGQARKTLDIHCESHACD